MKKKINYKKLYIVIFLVCILYLIGKITYSFYESNINGQVDADIADFKILINGEDVSNSSGTLDSGVILNNISWATDHTRENMISPGSSGVIELELDATQSEVAVLYEFQLIDKNIDSEKLVEFESISSDGDIIKTAADTYSGIITLADINNNVKPTINIAFNFDYEEDIEIDDDESQTLDNLFEIHFHAVQYQGEELVPYSEQVKNEKDYSKNKIYSLF